MEVESGIRYFLYHASRGWNTLPPLPRDVRELIYDLTYPRVMLRCTRCESILIIESLRRTRFRLRSHFFVEEDDEEGTTSIVCLTCLLPNESLLGQSPRWSVSVRHIS